MRISGTGLTAIIDYVVKLFEILRFSNLFPAIVLVGINIWLIFPEFKEVTFFQKVLELNEKWLILGSTFSIAMISYIFSALNDPIFRLFEGYPLKMSKLLGKALIFFQRHKKILYQNYLKDLKIAEDSADTEKQKAEINKNYRIYKGYIEDEFSPITDPDILPTKLGNRTAAFESYPDEKYQIDGVALWTRFVPILSKNNYMQIVEREKNLVDFFLYLSFLSIFFALEYIYLSLLFVHVIKLSLIALLAFFSYFFYLCACQSVIYWGDTYKIAFDLYRDDLRKALGIRNFTSYRDERFVWRSISQFLKSSKKTDLFSGGINLNYQFTSDKNKGENNERS